MLNKWIKAAVGAAVGIGIAATSFGAPTSFVTPTYFGEGTSNPGVSIILPTCASGDTISFIVKPTRLISVEKGGNTTTNQSSYGMVTALGAQAAGDSVSVSIDAGTRPLNYTPGWITVDTFASWLNTVGGNTTFGSSVAAPVKVAYVSQATIPITPYWRVRILTKSAITAGTQFSITFPRGNAHK